MRSSAHYPGRYPLLVLNPVGTLKSGVCASRSLAPCSYRYVPLGCGAKFDKDTGEFLRPSGLRVLRIKYQVSGAKWRGEAMGAA